jgi:hypothetical protein
MRATDGAGRDEEAALLVVRRSDVHGPAQGWEVRQRNTDLVKEKMTMEIQTNDDAVAFAKTQKDFAADFLKEVGELRPMVALLVTRDPRTRADLDRPMLLPIAYGGGARTYEEECKAKDMFADFVRKMARELGAVGAAFMSEVWMARPRKNESVDDVYKDLPRGLEDHPERVEAVIITVEHRALEGRQTTYIGRIERNGADEPKVLDYEEMPGCFEGRFANLLPVVQ